MMSSTSPEAIRASVERVILLITCGLVCPYALVQAGHVKEAVALMVLCVLAQLARPPTSWVTRAGLDSGMLYGTALISTALAANLLNQEPSPMMQRHAKLIFWCSVGCGMSACTETNLTSGMLTSSLRAFVCAGLVTFLALERERTGQRVFVFTTLIVFELGSQLLRRALIRSFTVGEALVVLQCVIIATTDFLALTASRVVPESTPYYSEHRSPVQVALQGGLLAVVWLGVVLGPFFSAHAVVENETIQVDPRVVQPLRTRDSLKVLQWDSLALSSTLVFVGICTAWLSVMSLLVTLLLPEHQNPILFVQRFTFSRYSHIGIVSFWFVALAIGLPLIHFAATRGNLTLIVVRKLYHLQALVMFVPAVAIAPEFRSLSFGVSTAFLLFFEYVRACRVPPLGMWLHTFMRSYTDSRDEGVAILTHLYLLLGCAFPVWVCQDDDTRLAPYAGMLILGAGDAAGAIVGSTFGRTRWIGGRKTLLGTFAAVMATLVCALLVVLVWLPKQADPRVLFRVVVATIATCLLEAFTTQIDNLVLPLYFVSVLKMV
jgi:dolichol kinase